MWKVAICSNMRAGSEYETAYYAQILGLVRRSYTLASVNVIYDREPTESRTIRALLEAEGIPVRYEIEKTSGSGAFPTIVDKVRQWAAIGNQGLELALSDGEDLTHIAAVEADLSYPYDVFEALLAREKSIIAPMIYLGNLFYDSWGFRDLTGMRLNGITPTFPTVLHPPIELATVGSFVLFDAAIFKSGIRYRGEDYEDGLLVGVCNDARRFGFRTYVDPTISVLHPVTAWRKQMWRIKNMKVMIEDTVVQEGPIGYSPDIAGPFHEFVEPVITKFVDHNFGAGTRHTFSLSQDPAAHTLDVTLNLLRNSA